jgi:hypothetical protein
MAGSMGRSQAMVTNHTRVRPPEKRLFRHSAVANGPDEMAAPRIQIGPSAAQFHAGKHAVRAGARRTVGVARLRAFDNARSGGSNQVFSSHIARVREALRAKVIGRTCVDPFLVKRK